MLRVSLVVCAALVQLAWHAHVSHAFNPSIRANNGNVILAVEESHTVLVQYYSDKSGLVKVFTFSLVISLIPSCFSSSSSSLFLILSF